MISEIFTLNEERGFTLTTYLKEAGNEFGHISRRPAMVVIPGGGYEFCSEREAEPIAFSYLAAGYQAFVLNYSVKENKTWPNPLKDYEQAVALICSRAEEWKIDPEKIAVIGFSSGGHLAACAATMAKHRPAAALLIYAVMNKTTIVTRNPSAPDPVSAVDDLTCPCFLAATRTDDVVPVVNTLQFAEALFNHDISFETHIYSYGRHGFSLGDATVSTPDAVITPRAKNWMRDSIDWLHEVLGDFGDGSMTAPVVGHHAGVNPGRLGQQTRSNPIQ